MSALEIVETFEEMAASGHQFLLENPTAYPDDYIRKNMEKFSACFEDKTILLSIIYASIYCHQMYGTSFLEYGTYHFARKSHREDRKSVV